LLASAAKSATGVFTLTVAPATTAAANVAVVDTLAGTVDVGAERHDHLRHLQRAG
jgi:hypothetical protein